MPRTTVPKRLVPALLAVVIAACAGSAPATVPVSQTASQTTPSPASPIATLPPILVTPTPGPTNHLSPGPQKRTPDQQETPAMPFELTSDAFADGEAIPSDYTCDGADLQPTLRWAGAPAGTAELALVMHDPDAGGFVHWVVAAIPADATVLSAELPAGAVAGRNDFGRLGYAGPCPPSGNHGYVFTLYALSAPLGLTGEVTASAVRQDAQGRTLATAVLNGTYRRPR